jgi:hypothetical protein
MVVSSGASMAKATTSTIRSVEIPYLAEKFSHTFGYSLVTDRCQKLGIDRGWIDRVRTDVGPITARTNHLVPP